jgi:hypothetical protein
MSLLNGVNGSPFLVEEISRCIHGQSRNNLTGHLFHRFLFDDAQNRERERLDPTYGTLPVTTRAYEETGLAQRWAKALPGHFQQPEAGYAANLNPGAIHFQCSPQPILDFPLVTRRRHINEIDDD